jgi:cob(I)alamin adenosyltransferase
MCEHMVRLTRIYTGGGDSGETSLGSGERVAKSDPRIAALGAVDEANAAIGVARVHTGSDADAMLARIQNDLFDLGADLCVPGGGNKAAGALRVTDIQVARLEAEIDRLNGELEPLESFILPGGNAAAAHLHLARTVVRRAECRIAELAVDEALNPAAMRYVNRLSDHLFVLARFVNEDDVLWKPGGDQPNPSTNSSPTTT